MSLIDSLLLDHRAIAHAFDEVQTGRHADAASGAAPWDQLQGLLQSHLRAEERVVYRALRKQLGDGAVPQEAYAQHTTVERQLLALRPPRGSDPAAQPGIRALRDALEVHFAREEQDLFPLLEECFDQSRLQSMDGEYLALRHEDFEVLLAHLRGLMPARLVLSTFAIQTGLGRAARGAEQWARNYLTRTY